MSQLSRGVFSAWNAALLSLRAFDIASLVLLDQIGSVRTPVGVTFPIWCVDD